MESVRRLGASHLAVTMATYGRALRLHQEALNALNVYPVPDGDTGTNMALTLESVVAALAALDGLEQLGSWPSTPSPTSGSAPSATSMAAVCKAIAHGSLMGARGNSGVILSQLLRGLTAVLADGGEGVDGATLARGLVAASDAARQAVLRPVEGTILTVARAAAEGAQRAALDGAGLLAVVEASRLAAADALAHTPEQLPVLAQAGVVDAGGSGYLLLLDAALTVIDGRPLPPAPAVTALAYSAVVAALPDGGSESEGPGAGDDLRYEVMY